MGFGSALIWQEFSSVCFRSRRPRSSDRDPWIRDFGVYQKFRATNAQRALFSSPREPRHNSPSIGISLRKLSPLEYIAVSAFTGTLLTRQANAEPVGKQRQPNCKPSRLRRS